MHIYIGVHQGQLGVQSIEPFHRLRYLRPLATTTERQRHRGNRINMQTAVAVLVPGVVALFGVTSAVLGFIAEAKRLKVKLVWLICRVAAVIGGGGQKRRSGL